MKILRTRNTPTHPSKILPGYEKNDFKKSTLNCLTHGDYQGNLIYVPLLQKYVSTQCPTCQEILTSEENERKKIKIAEEKNRKLYHLFGEAQIPERFKNRTFENYRIFDEKQTKALGIARTYAENFEERFAQGSNLILAGKPGTGKTHLATAIANHILSTERSVLFISALRAIRRVKECYRRNAVQSEQEAIDLLASSDLLILDEVGIQFGSQTEKLILFEILNSRYEAVLPTIVISNLNEEELSNYIGVRILDRLQEGGSVSLSFDWKSYRKEAHLDDGLPMRKIKESDSEKLSDEKDADDLFDFIT